MHSWKERLYTGVLCDLKCIFSLLKTAGYNLLPQRTGGGGCGGRRDGFVCACHFHKCSFVHTPSPLPVLNGPQTGLGTPDLKLTIGGGAETQSGAGP